MKNVKVSDKVLDPVWHLVSCLTLDPVFNSMLNRIYNRAWLEVSDHVVHPLRVPIYVWVNDQILNVSK